MIRRRRVLVVAMLALTLASRAVAQDEDDVDEEAVAADAEGAAPNAMAPNPMQPSATAAPAPQASAPMQQPGMTGGQTSPPVASGINPPGVTPPAAPGTAAAPGVNAGPGITANPGMGIAPQTPPATMQATPPPIPATGQPAAGVPAAGQPPAASGSAKRLGRQFPTPVNPPAPPEPPEVHVTIIPPPEPRVTTDRLRGSRGQGSQMGAGGHHGNAGGEHPAADEGAAE
jgi:hypothetical protein